MKTGRYFGFSVERYDGSIISNSVFAHNWNQAYLKVMRKYGADAFHVNVWEPGA